LEGMTPWQSFFLAWVAAQILPALLSDPEPENLVGVSLFLGSIVSGFMGLNALASWVGVLLRGSDKGI